MTLMHGLTPGETQLAMGLSVTDSKHRKTPVLSEGAAGKVNAGKHEAPKFSMDLVYEMEVPKDPKTVREKQDDSQVEDAPYFANAASQMPGQVMSPQVITALQNRISEANVLGDLYGDLHSQRSILMGALGRAQGLISSCLDAMETTGSSPEAAGYIADLSRLHTRILHSLSQITDPEKKGVQPGLNLDQSVVAGSRKHASLFKL